MEKETKRREIELRSEEFQEIVEQSPRWIIRSGVSLVLGLLVLLFAGSYFFKYPDVVEAKITLSSDQSLVSSLEQQSQIIGKVNLTIKEARKVAIGQKVNIQLADYPSFEYGSIRATVKSISQIPGSGAYTVVVELPQDLSTSFNEPIKFYPDMKGTAEIITADLRLIERFVNPLKSLQKRRNTSQE